MPKAGQAGPMYQAAKRQWLGSGLAGGGAGQNVALPVAVRDLRMAEPTHVDENAKYSAAIAELEVIEHMPAAMISPQENAEWKESQSALDRFFEVQQSAPYTVDCDRVVRLRRSDIYGLQKRAPREASVSRGRVRTGIAPELSQPGHLTAGDTIG